MQLVDAEIDVKTCMGRFRKALVDEHGRHERHQQWRLYLYPELKRMLEQAGFVITADCGDYGGSALTLCSPRMIVAARVAK